MHSKKSKVFGNHHSVVENKAKRNLQTMSWDELTDHAGNPGLKPLDNQTVEIEFLRREVLYQKEAAEAAQNTSHYTRDNAKYMLWSTIALAVSAILQALAMLLPQLVNLHRQSQSIQ